MRLAGTARARRTACAIHRTPAHRRCDGPVARTMHISIPASPCCIAALLAQIGRDRVKAAREHEQHRLGARARVVRVDDGRVPRGLAIDVHVVSPGSDARGDDGRAWQGEHSRLDGLALLLRLARAAHRTSRMARRSRGAPYPAARQPPCRRRERRPPQRRLMAPEHRAAQQHGIATAHGVRGERGRRAGMRDAAASTPRPPRRAHGGGAQHCALRQPIAAEDGARRRSAQSTTRRGGR